VREDYAGKKNAEFVIEEVLVMAVPKDVEHARTSWKT
jgi:hypothetical protein